MSNGVAVVTGAGRGLGKGIARALAAKGLTVYATGRSAEGLEPLLGEVRQAGGDARPVVCDHADDAQVKAAFAQIGAEAGHIDLLINNAAAVYPDQLTGTQPFWEKDIKLVDMIDVGLRSNYVATYHAAPLLLAAKGALVAHISFYGAVSYFHGPAYGATKAGTDKMAFDMGQDFSGTPVACVSFWPGFILTDALRGVPQEYLPEALRNSLPKWETPEFSGLVLESLWRDPERASFNGKTVIGAQLGQRYGIADASGTTPPDFVGQFGSPDGRFNVPASDFPI
jgi:NAD(P)-dependent dehydrogenase (short-subunit alcohol dehydrogenase family)